jgi:hypothetical protein
MRLSAEQHTRIAMAFEQAAANENLPRDLREEFWLAARHFRQLARKAVQVPLRNGIVCKNESK